MVVSMRQVPDLAPEEQRLEVAPIEEDSEGSNQYRPFLTPKAELILSSLAINVLMLAMPIMTLQVYDRVIGHKSEGTMLMLAIGILAVVVIDTALRLARSYITNEGSAAYEFVRMRELVGRTVDSWASRTEQVSVGDYVQAMGAVGRMREYAATRLLVVAVDVPFLFLFIGVLAYIGGWLVLAPMGLMLLFGVIIWHTGERLLDALARCDVLDTMRYSFILEALRGIHTIKTLGVEAIFARRFRLMLARASAANAEVAMLNQRLALLGALFAQGVIIVVLVAGAPQVVAGTLTLGGLIACVLLSGRLIQPLQHGLGLWVHHQEYRQSLKRIARLAELPEQAKDHGPVMPARGAVQLEEVSLSRDVTEAPLLDDVDWNVGPGEAVALRGREGAGRSVLLKLLAGVMPPDRGVVTVDGLDPTRMDGQALLRHVAYLPPEATLLRGSIIENLTGFDAREEMRAREIARMLGLEPLIVRLPQGYETMLEGGHSEMIPPGFCQRIAIARALRSKPRTILFDRADRSLDRDGYQHVFRLLAQLKGKATIIMVSDDENLIRLCDRVYLLEQGKLKLLRAEPYERARPPLTLHIPSRELSA